MKAALAYLLLPVSGLIAYLTGAESRTRFHGLQAIAFGGLWPLGLYAASAAAADATKVVFGLGVVIWVVLLVSTAVGRDPRIPLLGRFLKRVAETSPSAPSA